MKRKGVPLDDVDDLTGAVSGGAGLARRRGTRMATLYCRQPHYFCKTCQMEVCALGAWRCSKKSGKHGPLKRLARKEPECPEMERILRGGLLGAWENATVQCS